MEYLAFKMAISCSAIAYVWTELLTKDRQLLDFIPKYYPNSAYKPLTCAICLSGWLGIGCSLYCMYQFSCYWFVLIPFYSMVITDKIFLK